MAQVFVREIRPHVRLYRDERSGLALIKDGTSGTGVSRHSAIDRTGSIRGMKNLGYWAKKDRTVRAFGFIYNVDRVFDARTDLERIVEQECLCMGCRERAAAQRTAAAGQAPRGYVDSFDPEAQVDAEEAIATIVFEDQPDPGDIEGTLSDYLRTVIDAAIGETLEELASDKVDGFPWNWTREKWVDEILRMRAPTGRLSEDQANSVGRGLLWDIISAARPDLLAPSTT